MTNWMFVSKGQHLPLEVKYCTVTLQGGVQGRPEEGGQAGVQTSKSTQLSRLPQSTDYCPGASDPVSERWPGAVQPRGQAGMQEIP